MGLLLQEADRIAINLQLDDPDSVIESLKEMNLWPK